MSKVSAAPGQVNSASAFGRFVFSAERGDPPGAHLPRQQTKGNGDVFSWLGDLNLGRHASRPPRICSEAAFRPEEAGRSGQCTPAKSSSLSFGLYDAEIPAQSFFDRGANPEVWAKRMRLYDLSQKVESNDKIAQRVIARKIGIFKQPRWVALTALLPEVYPAFQKIIWTEVDFSSFPRRSALAALGLGKQVEFLNRQDGFVLSLRAGKLMVSCDRSEIKAAREASRGEQQPARRLTRFLSELSNRGVPFERLAILEPPPLHQGGEMLGREQALGELCRRLELTRENLYLKSARSARGMQTVRITPTATGMKIASDAEEFAQEILSAGCRSFTEAIALILETYDHPILEAEIPGERLEGERVEFRLICKAPFGHWFVTEDMAKLSPNVVQGHAFRGGHVEPTEKTLRSLWAAKLPDLSAPEVRKRAKHDYRELVSMTQKFAAALESNGYYFSQGKLDIAVDVVPVWNSKKEVFQYWLMEIQYPYGKHVPERDLEAVMRSLENAMELGGGFDFNLFGNPLQNIFDDLDFLKRG